MKMGVITTQIGSFKVIKSPPFGAARRDNVTGYGSG